MKTRTKKFRTNCQIKRFNKSIRILKNVFKEENISNKDVYHLANGHKLPKYLIEKKQDKINERIKKSIKKLKFFDSKNLED